MRKLKSAVLPALLLAAVFMLGALCMSAGASSDDPADSYAVMTAPNEDSSLSLWFDHSFRKTFTGDTTPTGKNTYSIYMAKNEIESAQFVLYSDTDKTGMSAVVTDFSDGKGHTVPAEIYYEMYVTTYNLNVTQPMGSTVNDTFIREGETPDPVVPLSAVGGKFKLNGGKSQAFLIRAKSSADTAPGWYSATLDIKNFSGQIVKTARVFCYVWDFVISEKTELKTSLIITDNTQYGGTYQQFYDYLLANRLCGTDIPGKVKYDNPYVTNDRVSAIRVYAGAYNGFSSGNLYMDDPSMYSTYKTIYNNLSTSPDWDKIKDKLYFYTADEPLPYDLSVGTRHDVNTTITRYDIVEQFWGETPMTIVPDSEDHPYPYNRYYRQPLSTLPVEDLYDSFQKEMDYGSIKLWCPSIQNFTPMSEINKYGMTYLIRQGYPIRTMCGPYSGTYSIIPGYFCWENIYGEINDRYKSYQKMQNDRGEPQDLWAYFGGSYNYCGHIIEHTGLQTKMFFWQLYQNDVSGYLLYASNNWNETGAAPDTTVTGSRTTSQWHTHCNTLPNGYNEFGNGVLYYGKNAARINVPGAVVGTIRVEIMRDGVEEYQMLKMLEEYKGKNAAMDMVSQVSTNVVNYLSQKSFDKSAFGMSDDYDIMESVRRGIGNAVAQAVTEGKCSHAYDEGVVTKEPTCLVMGTLRRTCTKCGAECDEIIPTLHTQGDVFGLISGHFATCTEDSTAIVECSVCGYRKKDRNVSHHTDKNYFVYTSVSDENHRISCKVCGTTLDTEGHNMFIKNIAPTCTADGGTADVCKRCGKAVLTSVIPAAGHSFEDGVCEVCGEPDPHVPTFTVGDLDGDGKINAKDINLLKQTVLGTLDKVPAADIDGDGKVTVADVALLIFRIIG